MTYNFDTIIDRKNTNSLKYDFAELRGMPSSILPLWVADMDFPCPVEVRDAVKKCAEHGIFGYTESGSSYFEAAASWFKRHFNYEVQREWLVKTPGIVYAIVQAIRSYTNEGDSVIIQPPVYYPFKSSVINNNRKLVTNPLVYRDGRYSIDFEDFERKIIDNKVKLFILCSPHNPVGRVWTKEELLRLGIICLKYGVIVVSDEIHADFTYPGYEHTIFSTLHLEFSTISIMCTAPSKTFNLAGLQCSNIWIEDPDLRKKFIRTYNASGYSQLNSAGIAACEASYTYGEEWLMQLKAYLFKNLEYLRNFLKENLAGITLVEPQGTYLVWLDFSKTGLTDDEIHNLIVHKAFLWLDDGLMFGREGSLFQRINIACPRSILQKALEQLAQAFKAD